ncbi:hypothetical protein PV08_11811 [Exophiala spinifera]|uniref:Uncharacterized protein n=1 Tax=Exophiala spinifera TaxID=91928 RepID=A0A0D2AUA8_9EURO|nr:uncharacterized protein PV08_11811 [Exophiala spinifera]KIW10035.1 hypothetical protein PV08_11811 [Exophiala spinifera]
MEVVMTPSQLSLVQQNLYAEMKNCAAVGIHTLRRTGERMEDICRSASELGGPGGLIESMMRYLDPNQPEARDRQLKRYISNCIEKSTGSVNILTDVRRDFEAWRELTQNILGSLNNEYVSNKQKQKTNKDRLRQCELERVQNQKEMETKRQELEEFELRIGRGLKLFENLINGIPRVGAALTSAAAIGLTPQVVLFTCVGLSVEYLILTSAAQEKTAAVQRVEREASALRDILEDLSSKDLTIAQVASIVRQALGRLDQLQQRVNMFLTLLIKLQKMVIIADSGKSLTLDPATHREERADPYIKKEILDGAYAMKIRFLFVSKVAELYNDIHNDLISPGANWLETFRPNESSQEDINKKLPEIEDLRGKICDYTEKMAATRYKELRESLETMPRTWEESVGNANTGRR